MEKGSNSDFIQRETLLTMYRNDNIDAKNAQNPNSHFTAKSDRIYKRKTTVSSLLASTNRLQKLPTLP